MIKKIIKPFICGALFLFLGFNVFSIKSYGENIDIKVCSDFDKVAENIAKKEIVESKDIEFVEKEIIVEKIAKLVEIKEKEEIVWAKKDCNAYEKYNIYSSILKEIKKDEKLKLTGVCENGWSRILIDDKIYYVESEKITTENPFKVIPDTTNKNNQSNKPVTLPAGLVSDGASNDMLRNAIRYWNLIPKHIRQAFVDDGWKLIITNKSLENMYGYSFSIIGITVYDDKTICVEARENAIRRALCHEVGHYWDYKQNWASYESEFEEIYNREKYTFNEQYKADNHCISSPVEFYAEIFAQSLMYPETAYPSAPDSCNYIWKN